MTVVIKSLNKEKVFESKEFITIGSAQNCDFVMETGFDFMLTAQINDGKIILLNNFKNPGILFKGQPMGEKLEAKGNLKLMIDGSDEFLGIKILENASSPSVSAIGQKEFTEEDIKELYGNDVNAATRIKIESKKAQIEKDRIAITKEIAYKINDLKKRISLNFKASVFLNIALFLSSLVTSFGVANYLTGLPVTEAGNYINLPTNIKLLALFTLITFGIALVLKQGVYLFFQNKSFSTPATLLAEKFMLVISGVFMVAFYATNLIYYMNPGGKIVFAVFISLFFIALTVTLGISCAYFKYGAHELSVALDKHEYNEEFENVLNDYQLWIEKYINNLSPVKLTNIKDKLFMLQLKGVGETILGILTAPFLAYGVSNTLAMCFPEAAGWIRISGLRFSPVFLVLATMLIIFAFFAFVNAFLCTRKIQGSEVIKNDGFRNFLSHGVDIFGLQNVRKLDFEKTRSLIIGVSIIFIEFSMNTSYFMTEIGGDLQGIFLSLIAALVPTALLIAETYMLSSTKYEIWASDELISKIDKI